MCIWSADGGKRRRGEREATRVEEKKGGVLGWGGQSWSIEKEETKHKRKERGETC